MSESSEISSSEALEELLESATSIQQAILHLGEKVASLTVQAEHLSDTDRTQLQELGSRAMQITAATDDLLGTTNDLHAKSVELSFRQKVETILETAEDRIVDIQHIPTVEPVPAADQIKARIISDDTLEIAGKRLTIHSKREKRLLNALLVSREKPRSARELRAFGLDFSDSSEDYNKNKFSLDARRLMKKLNDETGKDVLQVVAKNGTGNTKRYRQYTLNPNLVIEDARASIVLEKEDTTDVQVDSKESRNWYEVRETNAQRNAKLRPIIERYRHHTKVLLKLREYLRPNIKPPTSAASTLALYLHDIGRYRRLKDGEEEQLFDKLEDGIRYYEQYRDLDNITNEKEQRLIEIAAAHEILLHTNLRLVVRVAKRYASNSDELLDFCQVGSLGLSKAIYHRLPEYNNKFSTFAGWCIRTEITREIENTSDIIRLPTHVHDSLRKLKKAEKIAEQNGREVSQRELSAQLGVSPEKIAELTAIRTRQQSVSLQEKTGPNFSDATEIGDLIYLFENKHEETPASGKSIEDNLGHLFESEEIQTVIRKADLTLRETILISAYFGIRFDWLTDDGLTAINADPKKYKELLDSRSVTNEDLASLCSLKKKTISQIKNHALAKIKQAYLDYHSRDV